MKSCKKGIKKILLYPVAILIWFLIGSGLPACTDVENPRPLSDFEKTNDALPYFDVKLDSVGSLDLIVLHRVGIFPWLLQL
jgi:hypothetical protein